MSLKARIEAVIYAAEEPVALAQLASLFRDEALASRAARLAESSPDPEAPTEADVALEPQLVSEPAPPSSQTESGVEAGPAAESVPVAEAAEAAKKADRQRDREVRDEIRRLIDELIAGYNAQESGLEIREVAGGYRFATRPECHDAVRAFIKTL